MRRTGSGWDRSFFCRFVNIALASAFGAMMRSTELLPWFKALPPLVGGIPCSLFYCLRATENGTVATTCSDGFPTPHRRTPRERLMGREHEGADLWAVGDPQRSFLRCCGSLYESCRTISLRRLLRDLYAFHRWTKGQVQTHRHH